MKCMKCLASISLIVATASGYGYGHGYGMGYYGGYGVGYGGGFYGGYGGYWGRWGGDMGAGNYRNEEFIERQHQKKIRRTALLEGAYQQRGMREGSGSARELPMREQQRGAGMRALPPQPAARGAAPEPGLRQKVDALSAQLGLPAGDKLAVTVGKAVDALGVQGAEGMTLVAKVDECVRQLTGSTMTAPSEPPRGYAPRGYGGYAPPRQQQQWTMSPGGGSPARWASSQRQTVASVGHATPRTPAVTFGSRVDNLDSFGYPRERAYHDDRVTYDE